MHFLCYINSKKDHKVDWNHDTEAKLGNLRNLLPYCQLGFSSKIGMPQLGSARNLHGLARAGKFQLKLITKLVSIQEIFFWKELHIKNCNYGPPCFFYISYIQRFCCQYSKINYLMYCCKKVEEIVKERVKKLGKTDDVHSLWMAPRLIMLSPPCLVDVALSFMTYVIGLHCADCTIS